MLVAKRDIAQAYDTALTGRSDVLPMPRAPWATSNHWLYSVLCGSVEDAAGLVKHMQARHIEAPLFWRAISQQQPDASCPRLLSGIAASLSGRVVSPTEWQRSFAPAIESGWWRPCSTGTAGA